MGLNESGQSLPSSVNHWWELIVGVEFTGLDLTSIDVGEKCVDAVHVRPRIPLIRRIPQHLHARVRNKGSS